MGPNIKMRYFGLLKESPIGPDKIPTMLQANKANKSEGMIQRRLPGGEVVDPLPSIGPIPWPANAKGKAAEFG
jgi:hypothetical protein